MQYIIALDQGTTSSRALLFDQLGNFVGLAQAEFRQIFPQKEWVEHNPNEIWESQMTVFEQLIKEHHIKAQYISGIGLTNQRETTIIWDKNTGEPIYNALVWQDKRTNDICERWKKGEWSEKVRQKTGLVIDSYFSASKIRWLLDNIPQAREKAEKGDLLFGTVDTWLIWKMTKGKVHATDYSNASRTMLFNIKDLCWDSELLNYFEIPENILPEVRNSVDFYGNFRYQETNIPILGVAGDQQAALFGQTCWQAGTAKNTYGTGCFMLINTGDKLVVSEKGLLSTIAWRIGSKVEYALEGSIFAAGAAIQWLRDGLQIIKKASETESLAFQSPDNHGVIVVPAFAGLGAPYWDMFAKGAIFGLTRATTQADIVRATLESVAFQTKDVLELMLEESDLQLPHLQVDGGATANHFLMQFQSDILGVPVQRPVCLESTAAGAAYLAGIGAGLWEKEDLVKRKQIDKIFYPQFSETQRIEKYHLWQEAVMRILTK